MNLSTEQLKAVNTIDGQVIIISCPGSGKTTTVVARAHQMVASGIAPKHILVITFTKEAATQMKARYEREFPDDPTGIFWGTIHSFCFRVLAKEYNFSKKDILLPSEQWGFFQNLLYKKVKTQDFDEYIKELMSGISFVRNADIKPSKIQLDNVEPEVFEQAYLAYAEYKESIGKVDFDDMLVKTRALLQEKPDVLEYWKKQYPYIMVDEFQDTNQIQADICYMLAGENGNICIVGDDDQSIYRFRSADSSIMLNFTKVYPQTKKVYLSTNYRSTQRIITAARRLIEHNDYRFKKEIKGFRQEGGVIKQTGYVDSISEARGIVKDIKRLAQEGMSYDDMAVLYRTNSENLLLVGELMKAKIPFYTTEVPKDIHDVFIFGDIRAYYRLSRGIQQKGDLQRILNRPSRYLKSESFKNCDFTLENMMEACKKLNQSSYERAIDKVEDLFVMVESLKGKNTQEFLKSMLYLNGYKNFCKEYAAFIKKDESEILELLNMLKQESKNFESMEEWMDYADEYAEELANKKKEKNRSGVCLSSFHSSKGLEWDQVYLMNCNENYTPHKKAEKKEDYEEERRMFYVACTRAKNKLNLCYLNKTGTETRYFGEMGLGLNTK